MPLQTITVRVAANTAGMNQAFADATVTINNFGKSFQGVTASVVAAGNLMSKAFEGAFRVLTDVGRAAFGFLAESVTMAGKYQNALTGLISVSRAFGGSSDEALAAARRLSADGLLPLRDSAKGLQNLLMTGFNMKQSVDIMNALKDSAIFGREEFRSFGDSIRTTTEGIKNFRSQVSDNAGMTKNLSEIMKAAGMKLADLNDETKKASALNVLYLGILRETAAFQGDASRSLNTYQGAVTALGTAFELLQVEIGFFVTRSPAVAEIIRFAAEMMRKFSDAIHDNAAAYAAVSDGIELFVRAISGALTAIDTAHEAFTNFDTMIRTILGSVAQAASDVAGFFLDIIKAASALPGSGIVITAYAQEIVSLGLVQAKGAKIAEDATQHIKDNDKSIGAWSDNIKSATGVLDKLADKIHGTRGTMLDFGAGARAAGDAIDKNIGAGVKKITEFDKAVHKVQERTKDGISIAIGFNEMHGFKETYKQLMAVFNLAVLTQKMLDKTSLGLDSAPGFEIDPKTLTEGLVDKVKNPLHRVFADLVYALPRAIADAFENEESVFKAIAQTFADTFGQAFRASLKKALDDGRALTTREKAVAIIGAGIETVLTAFQVGKASGSKTKGALGGALAGAGSGAAVGSLFGPGGTLIGGGIGALVGGIGGLFGGIFGGKKKRQAEIAELFKQRDALIKQFGSFEKLQAAAKGVGLDMRKAFDTTNINEFTAAVANLTTKLQAQKDNVAALGSAIEGLNKRATLFADPFKTLTESLDKASGSLEKSKLQAQLAELAQRSQADFERLGIVARDAFAGLIRNGVNAIDALTQLGPTLEVLMAGTEKWGLESNAIITELITDYKLLNNEAVKPLFEQVAAMGQAMVGLMDAHALSPEGFQAAAADIGHSIQGIIDKTGEANRVLALNQPILQALWEAQQTYGLITDETTQKLLEQAEQQGLVGENMKSVNEQILDVLLAIGKVLGADLPNYLRALPGAAQDARDGINEAFRDVKIPEIEIPYHYRQHGEDPNIPAMATGGIVRRPTVALIGERGPEAVVPLTGGGLQIRGTTGAPQVQVTTPISIYAMDGASVQRVVQSKDFADAFERVVTRNSTGMGSSIRKVGQQ